MFPYVKVAKVGRAHRDCGQSSRLTEMQSGGPQSLSKRQSSVSRDQRGTVCELRIEAEQASVRRGFLFAELGPATRRAPCRDSFGSWSSVNQFGAGVRTSWGKIVEWRSSVDFRRAIPLVTRFSVAVVVLVYRGPVASGVGVAGSLRSAERGVLAQQRG